MHVFITTDAHVRNGRCETTFRPVWVVLKACFGLVFARFWIAFRFVLGYDMSFSTVPFCLFLICFTFFPDMLYVFPDLLYVFLSLLCPFPDLLYMFSVLWVQVIRRYKLSRTWASVPRPPAPILPSLIVDNLL